MKVYLAGPEVFFDENTFNELTARKKDILKTYNMEGITPFDVEICVNHFNEKSSIAQKIYDSNQKIMDNTDAIIANLTPFRGQAADSGTIFEIGYMLGQGKVAAGFTYDNRIYFERYTNNGEDYDENGFLIEDFGCLENLMIDCGIEKSGGKISTYNEVNKEFDNNIFDADVFEDCVRQISIYINETTGVLYG